MDVGVYKSIHMCNHESHLDFTALLSRGDIKIVFLLYHISMINTAGEHFVSSLHTLTECQRRSLVWESDLTNLYDVLDIIYYHIYM